MLRLAIFAALASLVAGRKILYGKTPAASLIQESQTDSLGSKAAPTLADTGKAIVAAQEQKRKTIQGAKSAGMSAAVEVTMALLKGNGNINTAKVLTEQGFAIVASMVSISNPILGLAVGFLGSLISFFMGGSGKSASQQLADAIMKEVGSMINQNNIRQTMGKNMDGIKGIQEELEWVPAMLIKNSPKQTQLSWYLVVQHDLAIRKRDFYQRDCIDEKYSSTACKDWMSAGSADLGISYAFLHLAILQQMALTDNSLIEQINDRVLDLGVTYKNVIKASINHYSSHRESQISGFKPRGGAGYRMCHCYLVDSFNGNEYNIFKAKPVGRGVMAKCTNAKAHNCGKSHESWRKTDWINKNILNLIATQLRHPANKLYEAMQQKREGIPGPKPVSRSRPPPSPPPPTTIADGTYALKGGRSGKWCADDGDKIRCNRNGIGPWEKFRIRKLSNGKYSLRSGKSHRYCADERHKILCNRGSEGHWEQYTLQKVGNQYALKGSNSGKWCVDESDGMKCNRDAIGPWEKFTLSKQQPVPGPPPPPPPPPASPGGGGRMARRRRIRRSTSRPPPRPAPCCRGGGRMCRGKRRCR